WSCDPQTPNACENLDTYGHTTANSLAAGGGYLWAGLGNGIILRCNPNVANQCDTWDNAGTKKSVASISYDGQGALYAALYTKGTDGLVWSCPIATANACSDVKTGVNASSVSAGAGGVFWSAAAVQTNDVAGGVAGAVYSNTTSLTTTSKDSGFARLLYIPAGGPAGVGGAKVTVEAAKNVARKLARGCRNGKNPPGTVVVSWDQPWFNKPYIFTTTFKACNLTKQGVLNWSYGLLNVGDYTVTVTVGKYSGYVRYSLQQGKKKPVYVSVGRR
ncbi:MAG: hypothetical protein ACR2J8_02205, partial [Thermomicrobiales bacterium]